MDQVHVLRHKVLGEGRSQRQVAKELGVSRLTVKKYLTEAVPIRRETKPRARPVWDTVGPRLEALLAASSAWTAGKQQLTATRLHELLVADVDRSEHLDGLAQVGRQINAVFGGDLLEPDHKRLGAILRL